MKRLLIITACIFAAGALAGAGLLGWLTWQRFHVREFTLSSQTTPGGQFADNFLSSSNGDRYICTRAEFSMALAADSFLFHPVIGRTADGQEIRAVPGSDAYVSLSGFMFPTLIFREESVPPVDLATLAIEEMQYFGSRGKQVVRKSTRDAGLISEVTGSLQGAPVPVPAAGQVDRIELISPDLPGLTYSIYVPIGPTGEIYLAPLYDIQHGVEGGPLFTRWVNQ